MTFFLDMTFGRKYSSRVVEKKNSSHHPFHHSASIIIAEITQRRMITQLVGTRPDVGCPRKNLTRTKKSRRREKTMTKIGMRSTTKRLRRTEFAKPTHCSRSMGNWDARLLPFAGLKWWNEWLSLLITSIHSKQFPELYAVLMSLSQVRITKIKNLQFRLFTYLKTVSA